MSNIKILKKGINVTKIIKQLEKYSDDWYIQRKGTDTLLERGYADIEAVSYTHLTLPTILLV